MPLASIGGATGALAVEGISYPRDLDPSEYDGLPQGWKPVEYAYKSGAYLGKTYVRFSSSFAKALCTPRKCIEAEAKQNGLSDLEVSKKLGEFDAIQKAKKERIEKEGLECGRVKAKGKMRDEAIAAFRKKHGNLDGATVGNLPGWKAESVYRESCQQTAVTYYNKDGYPFGTVMDVESFLGLKMQRGEDVTSDVEFAKSRVQKDETGKTINVARQEINITRTADDVAVSKGRKKRKRLVTPDQYSENKSLQLVTLSAKHQDWDQDDMQKLQLTATEIQALLVARGFKEPVDFVALNGYDAGEAHGQVLQGLFYRMSGKSEERPCFQRVFRQEASGHLACHKTYIFWSPEHKQWRIGYMDNEHAPFAFAASDSERPPGSEWMVLQ
mmetsp:Transcript_110199/g.212293  ORF Transcript_110199/g.212293 Transcript_110199/m.212293 type:complete len:385 (+) Transcript_110199:56-1210(+)